MPDNDEKLVQRCLRGETEAFSLLYDRYAPRVYSLLVRLTGNTTHAEDLAQETFIAAYRSLNTWRRQGAFGSWLCGIAVRLYHKNHTRPHAPEVDLSDEDWPADVRRNDPLDRLQRQELEALLEQAVGDLPAVYREVFVLLRIEGLSQREAAELLEVPLGTVQSRLGRATNLLRKHLDRQAVVGHEVCSTRPEGGAKDAMSTR